VVLLYQLREGKRIVKITRALRLVAVCLAKFHNSPQRPYSVSYVHQQQALQLQCNLPAKSRLAQLHTLALIRPLPRHALQQRRIRTTSKCCSVLLLLQDVKTGEPLSVFWTLNAQGWMNNTKLPFISTLFR
jgi:hypothetical protein